MSTCVYCQRTDPSCGFNTEHVIPEGLGAFRNNLTLSSCEVCWDCNQFFGDTLDLMLTRDSYEALLRIEHGLKDPMEIDGMFRRRLTVRLPADGTQWGGVILRLRPHPEGGARRPVVDLVPQVGFKRKDGGGWDYFAEEDLRAKPGIASHLAGAYGRRRVILFDSDEAREHVLAALEELGIPFKKEDEFRGFPPFRNGEVIVEVQARFDGYLARAVCKIAFNYMAKTQGAEFALRSEFDAARRYVRCGEGKGGAYLTFDEHSRFRSAAGEARLQAEHTLMLDWNGDREELIGHVHLFGETRYAVRLCTRWHGVWREIMSGHTFDLESREVTALGVTKIAPPWAGVPVRKRH